MIGLHELKDIIKELDKSSVSKLTFETNGTKIVLKKNTGQKLTHNEIGKNNKVHVREESEDVAIHVKKPDKSKTVLGIENITEIVSPMVGTFYRKPSPEAEAYVKIGDNVESNTTVCIVEAMKLFNEIEAEITGEISEILVEDGELVEYGQPLFKVKMD